MEADRAHRGLGGLRPDLRPSRPHPTQGPHTDPRGVFRLRRCGDTGRLRDEPDVLADAPAPRGAHSRSARARRAGHRGQARARRQPSLWVGGGGDGAPATLRTSTKDGLTMATDKRTKKADRKATTPKPVAKPADRTYDAIVIGAGHNGMVNGAYLAKAGLKTLILERRPIVG